VDSEGEESSVHEVIRMITRMFKKPKKELQKLLNKFQENIDKKILKDTETTT
jgi:hypothetical protein